MSNVRQDPSLEEGSKENMEKNANEKSGKTLIEVEKEQEAKLRSKYPALKGGPGPSSFLQKRLSKGQKYFDSGDYNMAKAKMGGARPMAPGQKLLLAGSTGDTIPTPESVPHRKASMPIATKMHPHPGLS